MRITCYTFLAAVAASALLSPSVMAQEADVTAPLTLAECIDTALRNQTDVVVARNNLTIAGARVERSTSAYLPQLTLQNNAFVTGKSGVLSRSTTGTAVNITQNIYDGGLRETSLKGARYGVDQSRAALERTGQTVAFSVTRAYYDTLRARHLADVSEANVKYNESLREQIQTQAELGEAALVDVLPVEAQLANARVNLLSARNSVRTALIGLQTAMGLTPRPGFDIKDVDAPPATEVAPLDDYMVSAIENRPDIEQSEANLGAAGASVKSARISLYPRPVVTGSYQRGVSGGFSDSGGQITGGIAFDIFDGGANRAALREAQASHANAVAQNEELQRNIRAQVEEAWLNLTDAKERMAASEASLAAAQRNMDAQKERYNQGLAITLDLLNAEVQLVTAQSNAVQARYDYYTAIAQMEYAQGIQGGSDGN